MLNQINLVVDDMDAAIAFYRRLGVEIDPGWADWPPGSGARHAEAELPGLRLEFDNVAMARIWHAARRGGEAGHNVVIGFSLSSREAVDERYGELTAAGYRGVAAPHDAFWGARYAIVQDPAGNDVGLMSPIDPAKRFVPTP
jgi:catechol 2,3-dioxygenase-like lactoylglutathione lyase family enzyme